MFVSVCTSAHAGIVLKWLNQILGILYRGGWGLGIETSNVVDSQVLAHGWQTINERGVVERLIKQLSSNFVHR